MSDAPTDYPDTIKVVVTREHIDKGARGSPSHCPIALALAEAGYTALLDELVVYLKRTDGPDGFNGNYLLPFRASKFVRDFDNDVQVKPSTFLLARKKDHGYG